MSKALADSPETTDFLRASSDKTPLVFADIYEKDVNLAVWQRSLEQTLIDDIDTFLSTSSYLKASMAVSLKDAHNNIATALGKNAPENLIADIADLVDMFCELLGLEQAGLRASTLDRAMCPRFHTDKVLCRLITTYHGVATEWLPEQTVDRSKLGPRSLDTSDIAAGLYKRCTDIQQLKRGDVALLKGETWPGNANGGIVHRSPEPSPREKRLLITLDVIG